MRKAIWKAYKEELDKQASILALLPTKKRLAELARRNSPRNPTRQKALTKFKKTRSLSTEHDSYLGT